MGWDGVSYEVRGTPNRTFSLVSSHRAQLNGRFAAVPERFRVHRLTDTVLTDLGLVFCDCSPRARARAPSGDDANDARDARVGGDEGGGGRAGRGGGEGAQTIGELLAQLGGAGAGARADVAADDKGPSARVRRLRFPVRARERATLDGRPIAWGMTMLPLGVTFEYLRHACALPTGAGARTRAVGQSAAETPARCRWHASEAPPAGFVDTLFRSLRVVLPPSAPALGASDTRVSDESDASDASDARVSDESDTFPGLELTLRRYQVATQLSPDVHALLSRCAQMDSAATTGAAAAAEASGGVGARAGARRAGADGARGLACGAAMASVLVDASVGTEGESLFGYTDVELRLLNAGRSASARERARARAAAETHARTAGDARAADARGAGSAPEGVDAAGAHGYERDLSSELLGRGRPPPADHRGARSRWRARAEGSGAARSERERGAWVHADLHGLLGQNALPPDDAEPDAIPIVRAPLRSSSARPAAWGAGLDGRAKQGEGHIEGQWFDYMVGNGGEEELFGGWQAGRALRFNRFSGCEAERAEVTARGAGADGGVARGRSAVWTAWLERARAQPQPA